MSVTNQCFKLQDDSARKKKPFFFTQTYYSYIITSVSTKMKENAINIPYLLAVSLKLTPLIM